MSRTNQDAAQITKFKGESGVQLLDGNFTITDTRKYLDALEELYRGTGNPMHADVRESLRDYLTTRDGIFPTSDHAGGFPGSHAEIQAVNDPSTLA